MLYIPYVLYILKFYSNCGLFTLLKYLVRCLTQLPKLDERIKKKSRDIDVIVKLATGVRFDS